MVKTFVRKILNASLTKCNEFYRLMNFYVVFGYFEIHLLLSHQLKMIPVIHQSLRRLNIVYSVVMSLIERLYLKVLFGKILEEGDWK
jgi:hypothetical protein